MAIDLCDNNFADEFKRLLKKTDVSCYQISQFTDIDQGYLSRLRSGEKANPSRETAFAISYALAYFGSNVDLGDVKDLLHSAGYFVPLKQ